MKILILGSGVIGVTSAWYLAREGHEVTVIDRQPAAAEETSASNAGQISPGYATPWAAPGIPLKAIKWMFQKHAPLAISTDGSLFQLQWMWQMLRNCNAKHYAINKERMVRIAEYSRDCLRTLRSETGIDYEERQGGTLQLFRSAQQFEHAQKDIAILQAAGVPFELLEAHELPQAEPALIKATHKLTGGLRLPNDETGDCQIFTKKLAKMAADAGVTFLYNCTIDQLLVEHNTLVGVRCNDTIMTADCYIVACGSWSTTLLKDLVTIPVYPLKGYSLTLPIINSQAAPISTVLDETYKIAVTRFNDRIRVGGMAEIVGYNTQLKNARQETLKMVVNDLFPNSGDLNKITFWTGLRPMTPDGTPIVGQTKIQNLYLNTGHGTLGWTMACGSGQLLADIISGVKPAIPYQDLSVMRYLNSNT